VPAAELSCDLIELTAVRLEGGDGHEHVRILMWCSAATPAGVISRQGLVDWLSSSDSNRAVVLDGGRSVQVEVVRSASRPPCLRTRADGVWTDDLLALPRF
jgi:hypothetical protein